MTTNFQRTVMNGIVSVVLIGMMVYVLVGCTPFMDAERLLRNPPVEKHHAR